MDSSQVIDLVFCWGFAIFGGVASLFAGLTVHAPATFPTVNFLSFECGKRKELTLIWMKIALVALGGVLIFVLMYWLIGPHGSHGIDEVWPFIVAAGIVLFLVTWVSFRMRLFDALWTFTTYAVLHLISLAALGPDWLTR
jgi:hypothetical protein